MWQLRGGAVRPASALSSSKKSDSRWQLLLSLSRGCCCTDSETAGRRCMCRAHASKILSSPLCTVRTKRCRACFQSNRIDPGCFPTPEHCPCCCSLKSNVVLAGYAFRSVDADAAVRQHKFLFIFLRNPHGRRHSRKSPVGLSTALESWRSGMPGACGASCCA
jgi:hypothetical protein